MTLSPGPILQQAWDLIKAHVDLAIRVFLVFLGADILRLLLTGGDSLFANLMDIVFSIVDVWLTLGLTVIVLRVVRGQPTDFSQLFSQDTDRVITYIVASIIFGIAVALGFVLFIIPGIIISIMYSMFGYVIVDEGAGILESLQRSQALTSGHLMDLLWIGIVFILLNMVGALLFGIGLAITIPVTMVGGGVVYTTLKSEAIYR